MENNNIKQEMILELNLLSLKREDLMERFEKNKIEYESKYNELISSIRDTDERIHYLNFEIPKH